METNSSYTAVLPQTSLTYYDILNWVKKEFNKQVFCQKMNGKKLLTDFCKLCYWLAYSNPHLLIHRNVRDKNSFILTH